ncbi:MAG: hypothetical protein V1703_01335, partial [Candidatus Altiarchaeota archaeon]
MVSLSRLTSHLKERWDLVLWGFIILLAANQFIEVSKFLPHVTYNEWNYTVVPHNLNKSLELVPMWTSPESAGEFGSEYRTTPFNLSLGMSDVPQELHFLGTIDVPEGFSEVKFMVIADDCVRNISVNNRLAFDEQDCKICPDCVKRGFDISKLCIHCDGKEFDSTKFLKPGLNKIDATVLKTYGIMRFRIFEATHAMEKWRDGATIFFLIMMACLFTTIRKRGKDVLSLSIVNSVTILYLIALIRGWVAYENVPTEDIFNFFGFTLIPL